MTRLDLGPNDALDYEHHAPSDEAHGVTFVFFNPLTGDRGAFEASIAPELRAKGHGSLSYNMRGQAHTAFDAAARLTPQEIVADAGALLDHVAPTRPVYVGHSIGGLFAMAVHLGGREALGMVLINTLRRHDSLRLAWLNDALARAARLGGLPLVRDLYAPLLFGEAWQRANRANFLTDAPYEGLDDSAGAVKLLDGSGQANWDVAYEQIKIPAVALTGLEDRLFYEERSVQALLDRLPLGREIRVPDVGHMIPVEKPQAVVDACLSLEFTR